VLGNEGGLAATGGADGVVRLWDIASGAPTGAVAQPAGAAVAVVALSADGRYVGSAGGTVARAARVADGSVLAEIEMGASVTTLAFAPDGAALAVADSAGGVVIAPLGGGARATTQLAAAATSLAFAADGNRFAAADVAGGITLVSIDGEVVSNARHWRQPIRWIGFSPDGGTLLAATDAWLHALAATPDLAPAHSKLVVWPAASAAFAAVSNTVVRFAGVGTGGVLAAGLVDVTAAPSAPADAAFVGRDWSAVFALRLNDNGEPVPTAP
jgi:hypothetical protein